MLFLRAHLDGIAAGTVRLAFRRWTKPSTRSGGTLLTGIGRLRIGEVTVTTTAAITDADARRAGYSSRAELVAWLEADDAGQIYRIEIEDVEADPRIALRARPPTADELADLTRRLDRLDKSSPHGPWTRQVLALIDTHPGVRAGDLAAQLGRERLPFKVDVRKLKNLGLTESLEVGYRLSPRGRAVLTAAQLEAPQSNTRARPSSASR
jgi:hypothetical protein